MSVRLMRPAFTIVELLVVITIIVVLLALLAPALDQAIYQAELAVCAANQKAVASSTATYTLSFARAYPYRTILEVNGQSQPILLHRNLQQSEIAVFRSFLSINDHLQDPLVQPVDLTVTRADGTTPGQHVWVYSSLAYWAGWRFTDTPGRKGMRRLGDAFEWEGASYRLIASDHDMVAMNAENVQSKHPDADGVMYNQVLQNAVNVYAQTGSLGASTERITYSTWTADNRTWARGPIDMNAALDDGSVARYNTIPADTIDDDRMVRLPAFSNALRWAGGAGFGVNVPRSGK
jgi:prepilin-type N-terminal cleavage/methylation domain-containing protein